MNAQIFQTRRLWFYRLNWKVITVSGHDRLDFLQRLTSQDFLQRSAGDSFLGAILKGNGGVIGLFQAWIQPDSVTLISEPANLDSIMQYFDQFHFGEDVTFTLSSMHMIDFFGERQLTDEKIVFLPGEVGGWLAIVPDAVERVLERLDPSEHLSADQFFSLRSYLGRPEFGVDINSDTLLLEYGLDRYVHRNKGCYPGQEVVERLYTYGNAARFGLAFEPADESSIKNLLKIRPLDSNLMPLKVPILHTARNVGFITSIRFLKEPAAPPTTSSLFIFCIGNALRLSCKLENEFELLGMDARLKIISDSLERLTQERNAQRTMTIGE